MNSQIAGGTTGACLAVALIMGIGGEGGAQALGPRSDFVEAAIDARGEYAYFRMRGAIRTPPEAVKVRLGESETAPHFVGVVSVETREYQTAWEYTMRSGNSSGGHTMRMEDGCRFIYRTRQALVEKQAPGSQDKLGEVRIPNSPGRLRASGCVLSDDLRGHLYIGTARGPSDPAQVVKIRAGGTSKPPVLVGSITLDPNESNIACGAVDPVNGYAYFGTDRRIVKVALGEPAEPPVRVAAISLRDHERDVKLALMDVKRGFVYFADEDTVVKVALGDGPAPPRLVGSTTLQKPQYGDYAIWLFLPASLPLVLVFVLPTSLWRGRLLNWALTLIFVGSMVLSLAELHLFGVRALYGSFLAAPAITVPFFFLLPLCQTFLQAVAAGRRALGNHSGSTPVQQFRRVLTPHLLLWSVLWVNYLIGLEFILQHKFGGGNLVASAVCMAFVFGMLSACFVWAPRYQTLRGLTLAVVSWTFAAIGISAIVAIALIGVFDAGGYMGIGYVFFAPIVVAGLLMLLSIVCGSHAVLKGNAWFRGAQP
jgi:hypothetical protein